MIAGAALIVPQGLLDRLAGERDQPMAHHAKDTAAVERRAIAAVLAAGRALGREPTEMPHNNPGFDILSVRPEARPTVEIEVKGRIAGSDDFFITRTEVLRAKPRRPLPSGPGRRPPRRPGPRRGAPRGQPVRRLRLLRLRFIRHDGQVERDVG